MKKALAILLVLTMVLAMAACSKDPGPSETTAAPTETEPAGPIIEKGTSWNAVEGFHTEADPDSVWQYYFFDPMDSSYNPMNVFLNHEDEDIHSWYPWEGSWVGVGFNNGEFCNVYGQALEQNADGPGGMVSVIGFIAPADGEYVVTGKLMNAFDQNPDLYTVVKEDGTVVVAENFRDFIKGGYTFLTPTKVTLKAGERLFFQCMSTSDWVSTYTDITVHYEPTDPSVMEKPESYIPVPEYPTISLDATTAKYNAIADFNQESATEGPWVYAITADGVNFEPMSVFVSREWDDDADPDALEWYTSEEDYTGVGINADVEGLLELNVSESFENGGSAAALGFQAPADGTYSFTVFTRNVFEQNADKIVASVNGSVVAEIPFSVFGNAMIIEVPMAAGDVVYFHGVSNGGWVSAYATVLVNEYSAIAGLNQESATEGPWVYAITADGVNFEPMSVFVSREWDDDPDPDALEWYTSEEDYTGVGINADVQHYLELNVSNTFDNGGSAAALGFQAPADGTYEITICTNNVFGQNSETVALCVNGTVVDTVPFLDIPFGKTVSVTLAAGETAYIYGISAGDWVSCYAQVAVNPVG